MAILNMRYEGDEILRKKCKEIKAVDDRIREILDDMAETLSNTPNGAAVAANQLGILKRLVVIDMGTGLIKLVNPVIRQAEGEQEVIEGCLSFPDKVGKLKRPRTVVVEALNENGETITLTGTDEMAKCFCHEIDHLDGICFTDKVTEWL
nr:peptide deformylase [Clostridium sp. Marseille-P2415]